MRKTYMRLVIIVAVLAGLGIAWRFTHAPIHPVASLRLTDNVRPQRYQLHLNLDLQGSHFTGNENIDVAIKEPTNSIFLHSVDLDIKQATIQDDEQTQVATIVPHQEFQQIELTVPEHLKPGTANIIIEWSAPISSKLRGLYGIKVDGRAYAFTQFEATDARRAFPCFDEPDKKARFRISVATDDGNIVVSNQSQIYRETSAGKQTAFFAETPPISTYLVALAAGPLVASETVTTKTGVPIRVLTVQGREKLTAFALQGAKEALERLTNYFEIPYPYSKLDLVGVPDFAEGAMENAGLLTFRETSLLIDAKTSGISTQIDVLDTITHEIAHQWFGNLVTMRWWDDLWLNEAFATWMATEILTTWKPEWHLWELFNAEEKAGALAMDALEGTHPIRTPITTAEEAGQNFDRITYSKGASVLRMLQQFIGEDAFRRGLRSYLKKHADGNATAHDLWVALSEAADQPIEPLAEAWVNQPGYPLIHVMKSPDANGGLRVYLAQEPFFTNPIHPPSDQLWLIPVCLKTPHESKCLLMRSKTLQILLPASQGADALIVNLDDVGFYRVQYSPDVWKELATTHLSLNETIGLINDANALMQAGKLPLTTVLDLLQALGPHRSVRVASQYTDTLVYLENRLVQTTDQKSFRGLVEHLFRPLLNELGWNIRPQDTDQDRVLRGTAIYALGRLGRAPDILAESRRLMPSYLANRDTVDGDVGSRIPVLAALEGDADLYEQYLQHFRTSTDPEERHELLFALARFEKPALLAQTLRWMLTSDVQSQDLVSLLTSVLGLRTQQKQAWTFVKENWEAIRQKGDETNIKYLVERAGALCDAASAEDARTFFTNPAHRVAGGEEALKSALDSVAICIAFRAREEAHFQEWLSQHYPVKQR